VASTLAYLLLYLLLRPLGAQQANAIALLVTAIANTAANRRLTFAIRGHHRLIRNQLQGLAVFALGLAVTSGALALMHGVFDDPSRLVEVAALIGANGMATLLRFVLLRTWVFDGRARTA
jgi:putative flippase GtrA